MRKITKTFRFCKKLNDFIKTIAKRENKKFTPVMEDMLKKSAKQVDRELFDSIFNKD